ncbi:MAG: PAS domain-containing sensor histidine kinase [Pedobacter sp.]|nr:MAG: PAS domain-containing sensor histidine kinase [Pedobacter sp.]
MSGKKQILETLIDADELYHSAPCGYFSLSTKGEILKINKTLLNWLGYAESDLLETRFALLLPKGGQMHFEMFFLPMLNVDGMVKELSYEILRKDQTPLSILLNANTILDQNGNIKAINVVVADVTERKNYERELLKAKSVAENEQKRLEFMADLIPEMIWTASSTGRINYVNARFCQYFECEKQETRSSFILSKVHTEDLRNLLRSWYKSQSTGTELNEIIRLINRDGNYEWHQLKASLYVDKNGDRTNWFGSCTNVEDHIEQLKKKDEFINIASHELKTPITSLKAILQLMLRMKAETSERMSSLIEKANHNITRVTQMVDDLLNASQMNDGHLKLNKTKFNVSEMIGSCVHHIRIENNYQVQTNSDAALEITADEGRIEQVVSNFIINAIKYAPESQLIVINVKSIPGFIRIEVIDKGKGIQPDKIPYLFERYYQVSSTFYPNGQPPLRSTCFGAHRKIFCYCLYIILVVAI